MSTAPSFSTVSQVLYERLAAAVQGWRTQLQGTGIERSSNGLTRAEDCALMQAQDAAQLRRQLAFGLERIGAEPDASRVLPARGALAGAIRPPAVGWCPALVRRTSMVLLTTLVSLLVCHPEYAVATGFTAAARDAAALERAIATERPAFTPPPGVTGITVPHHLLAADLVARGFWAACANHYERILLIAPDHFRRVQGQFAVVREDLATVFGTVPVDTGAVATLLAQDDLFEPATAVSDEHGVMSVAPFIRRFFPGTPVVSVIASANSRPESWKSAERALAPLVNDRTLIVQSTDYSHYLPLGEAIARDQESLATIAAGDPGAVRGLRQPGHLDSLAAQYLQLALQGRRLGGQPVIVANRNSVEYGSGTAATTSYIVTVYLKDPAAAPGLTYGDQQRLFFAGDTLLGRYFAPVLRNEGAVHAIADRVLEITGGAPLIVNLEGVLVDEPIVGQGPGAHVMLGETAMPLLERLHVVAAGLANNHSQDLGDQGLAETMATLSRHGIAALTHGDVADLGGLRVLPLTFHRGRYRGTGVIAAPADLATACNVAADPPLVALVHWGVEYTDTASDAERDAALTLNACGIAVVVGAHSHQASPRLEVLAGGAVQLVFSLGNVLFDQDSARSSGALLEVRTFHQRTIAVRLLPIPNLFELGSQQSSPVPPGPVPHFPRWALILAGRTNSNCNGREATSRPSANCSTKRN
jgi:AmmeMemoRadiSam system protein B